MSAEEPEGPPKLAKIPQLPDGRIDTAALGATNPDGSPKGPEELAPHEQRCDCPKCAEIWSKPVEYPEPDEVEEVARQVMNRTTVRKVVHVKPDEILQGRRKKKGKAKRDLARARAKARPPKKRPKG